MEGLKRKIIEKLAVDGYFVSVNRGGSIVFREHFYDDAAYWWKYRWVVIDETGEFFKIYGDIRLSKKDLLGDITLPAGIKVIEV